MPMNDKNNLEKFLRNFIADEKEASMNYLSQVLTAKMNRMVNEPEIIEQSDSTKIDQ